MYTNQFVRSCMPRDRFLLLMRTIHFAPQNAAGLEKVKRLIESVESASQRIYTPGQEVAQDETMIGFRGRVAHRQYIPGKRHKYGLKLFKACTPEGYTWSMFLYGGKAEDRHGVPLGEHVVMKLGQGLVDSGRIYFMDNFYTSISLADHLLQRNTALCGTIRRNRRDLPGAVVKTKLRKGEHIAYSKGPLTCVKWRDKRDVLMLSSCFGAELRPTGKVNRNREPIQKPAMVLAYNEAKGGIDLSDQIASYHNELRKSMKWSRKVGFAILLGVAVVNSYIIYRLCRNERLQIDEFREQLVLGLCKNAGELEAPRSWAGQHFPAERDMSGGRKANSYRRCGVLRRPGARPRVEARCDSSPED